jgi:parvulin-like peptidyl-prolyl isomerase
MEKQLSTVNDAVRIKTAYQSIGDLVKREILYVEAVKKGVTVPDAAVEARLKEGISIQQESAKKAGVASITEEELLAESGKTRAELLDAVRKSMIIEKMQDQIAAKEAEGITQEDIKKFYDARPELFRRAGGFHLKQIFIQPKPSATDASEEAWEAARKAVEKGLARIKAGESFEAVAKDISESKDRNNGGDMGILPEKDLPDFVVAAARKLKNGELSDLVKSSYGYHIFKLISTEREEVVPLSQATPKIKVALQEVISVNAVDAFAINIMQDVDRVQIFLKLEKAIALLSEEELKMLAPDDLSAN